MKYIGRIILVSVLIVIGYGFSEVYVNKVDFFSRDVLQYFNSNYNSQISDSISIIDIDTNSGLFSNPITSKQIESLLKKIKEKNPKLILLSMEPKDFSRDEIATKSLYSVFDKYSAYVSTDKSQHAISSFEDEPTFKDFKFKLNTNYCTDSSRGSFSPRRMFLKFYSDKTDNTISKTLNENSVSTIPASEFKYSYDRMNTQQIFNKFHDPKTFTKLSANEIINGDFSESSINNKIIIVGRIDEFGFMQAERLRSLFDVPLAGSTMNNSLIPTHHVLASHVNTLITGDYVKLIKSDYTHYFVILLIIILTLINIDSRLKLLLFLLFQLFLITIQILIYAGTSFYIDFTTTYVMLIFLQYLLVPLIAFAIFKEQKLKQLEGINNARIDALLLISEKVAHDIRSPLSAMNLLLKKVTFQNEEQKNIFINSINRIELITQNILTKYKPNDNGEKLKLTECFSAADMINEIISEKKITHPSIAYIFKNATDTKLTANKLELSRILSNLLDNSIHALTEQTDPKITISLEASSASIRIKVEDNGKGIPDSVIQVIGTERFSTKPFGIGNGIGLLHAKRSIEEMSGSFEIDSKDGEYTKVTIVLPISTS